MNIWEKLTNTSNNKSETVKEFNKRYYNTILGFKKENETTIFLKYRDYDSENNIFKFKSETNLNFYFNESNPDLNDTIFIPKIPKGFYNYKNHLDKNSIIYLTNTPNRQWRRGICEDNYKLLNYSEFLYQNVREYYTFEPEIFQILKNYYNKNPSKTPTNKSIFTLCDINKHHVINNNFLLTQNIIFPVGYTLFFHKYIIGHFLDNKNFYCTDTLFLQEFIEEIQTWNFDFRIHYGKTLDDCSTIFI